MKLFSERMGYVKPSKVFIREDINESIINAINNAYYYLDNLLHNYKEMYNFPITYNDLELELWVKYCNGRIEDFYDAYGNVRIVAKDIIYNKLNNWYKPLDIIEFTIASLDDFDFNVNVRKLSDDIIKQFSKELNQSFERLNYAYRVVDKHIVEINSEGDIQVIEQSINDSQDNVKMHLQQALALYAKRPDPDYRDSIKESINAVEALCNNITGEGQLSKALLKLEKRGIEIQPQLKQAFTIIYGGYASSDQTGVRHAKNAEDNKYIPSEPEAYFMLVSCSTFINYLNRKRTQCV